MFIVNENDFVAKLVKNFARSPLQINTLQESDAELIRLNDDLILAATTDSICEEIERKIYEEPYLIGWMIVTVNVSDLAAVGAAPLGILLNQTFTREMSSDSVEEIQRGIQDACNKYKVFLLGGDTNFSTVLQMGGTAIGLIDGDKILQRKGCAASDILYCSSHLGSGNAYAFCKLTGINNGKSFKPKAKVNEGKLLRQYASSCMDTSDGMFATLDQLMRVNNCGFKVTAPIENYLSREVKTLRGSFNIPEWFMLAGPHGEFELIFTVPPISEYEFLMQAEQIGWKPLKLGMVSETPKIEFMIHEQYKTFDTGLIRNLFNESNHDLSYYVNELMKIENNFIKRAK